MQINIEYENKVKCLLDNMHKRMYHPCQTVTFTGFITRDRLSFQEACKHEKRSFSEGETWGKKWEYGWFFSEITLPESCKGRRIVFKADLGECLVFVNGKVHGSLDREHFMITLTDHAKGGEHFQIAMEVYAGHGETFSSRVVIPEENITEFPEDIEQKTIRNGNFGIFYEEVFQLWVDLSTLFDMRYLQDVSSLRRANIHKCVRKVCDTVNIEAPLVEFLEHVQEARKITASALECHNGTSAATVYAIGNSHLDLEWLWTIEETRRKSARTLGNQLRLLEEYGDYKYFHSQPWILESIKKDYPDLYEEVKEQIRQGRIIPEGGMWVEADTNIPSGESLIRQFIVGKRFLQDEFDMESEILWLPDVFGCSATLPQIMKGCGVKYFFNAKVWWIYHGGDPFPYNNFVWKGLDGTGVLTHITYDYASDSKPCCIFDKWDRGNNEKEEIPVKLIPYGYGDGGGGATRTQVEYIQRQKDLEGIPKVITASPKEFFQLVESEYNVDKTYRGELYYAAHRGTYTSQGKLKKLNRQSERMLREAEMWSSLFRSDNSAKEELYLLWKDVLFNQFHDIIPGSSITEVNEMAEESYANALLKAENITETVLSNILRKDAEMLTIFNALSWSRNVFVKLPEGYHAISDDEGNFAETQDIEDETYALLEVPSCGAKTYRLHQQMLDQQDMPADDGLYLENNLIRASFNEKGELISVIDKDTGMEFLNGASNKFRMYQDMPTFSDAWDIDSFYEQLEVELTEDADVEIECRGNLMSSLIIKKKLNQSEIKQRVILRKDSRRIDFETEIDWQETHKLLKVDVDTNIHTEELLSEIQFGYIKRPTHKNRQHDADRFEVCQHKWSALAEGNRGVAILNDCKYGISADEGRIGLTLLKSSAAPALYADKGVHHFTYSILPFVGTFFGSNVVQEAYELNYPAITKRGEIAEQSLLQVSEKNVIVETVKPAEDESGDLIVRLYECQNTYTHCNLEFGFDVKEVYLTNMLEKNLEKKEIHNNTVSLKIKAFEIVTLRVRRP